MTEVTEAYGFQERRLFAHDAVVVPKERVRLSTEEHTDEATVSEEVRKERIETDGDARA
jgi:hypothetical protein